MSGRGGKRPGAGRPRGSTTERTERLVVRATPAEIERWRDAAEAAGLDLSPWVRGVLGAAHSAALMNCDACDEQALDVATVQTPHGEGEFCWRCRGHSGEFE